MGHAFLLCAVLFSLLCSFLGDGQQYLAKASEIKSWRRTKLYFPELRRYIKNKNCKSSERKLVACYLALFEGVSYLMSEDLVLLPISGKEEIPNEYAELFDGEAGLAIVSGEIAQQLFPEIFSLNPGAEQDLLLSIQLVDAFQSDPDAFDFAAGFNAVAELHTGSKLESAVTGYLINTYLRHAYDPHTYIYPSREFLAEAVEDEEDFEARIGIEYDSTIDGKRFVKEVMPGSAAESAGVAVSDEILSLPSETFDPALDSSAQESVISLKRRSEKLTLKIEPTSLTIKDYESTSVSATSGDLDLTKGFFYVRLRDFIGTTACEQFQQDLSSLKASTVLVLDLRGNGGGDLEVAQCLYGSLVGADKHLATVIPRVDLDKKKKKKNDRKKNKAYTVVSAGVQFFRGRLITLVDGDSASASELIVGNLIDQGRTLVIGSTSYGKGSLQTVQMKYYGNRRIAFAQTDGVFYFERQWSHQGVGIEPDFPVKFAWQTEPEEHESKHIYPLIPIQRRPEDVPARQRMLQSVRKCLEKTGEIAFDVEPTRFDGDPVIRKALLVSHCLN